jgi:hypothetical protein
MDRKIQETSGERFRSDSPGQETSGAGLSGLRDTGGKSSELQIRKVPDCDSHGWTRLVFITRPFSTQRFTLPQHHPFALLFLQSVPRMVSMTQPIQQAFNPYTENGGTILAIAGADFSVIAGDTRQSEGYSIQTRYAPKVFKL